jgi:hypothetical protein
MKIAYAVSERSTCDRAFVGCVLVLDKRILTTGFNGSPAPDSRTAMKLVTYWLRVIVSVRSMQRPTPSSRLPYMVFPLADAPAMSPISVH